MSSNINIVHNLKRPNAKDYINTLFPDFVELRGDRYFGDDPSIIGGITTYCGKSITVIGQVKGRNLNEHVKYNFSMCKPEGYRKIIRLMKQAEKFERPVICFVDTYGAYPGKEAEDRGQGSAIANCILESLNLKTPIISVLLGDGGSGGALALCVSDSIIAMEYATLSVISPKACAEILWRDLSKDKEAAIRMKMDAKELLQMKIVNKIIPEPCNGAHNDPEKAISNLNEYLWAELQRYIKMSKKKMIKRRLNKYLGIGRGDLYKCKTNLW